MPSNTGPHNIYTIYKRAYIAGLAGYLAMLVLAFVFYKERIIFCDASFYLFNMLKTNAFFIQHMRFGMVSTQVLPLMAVQMGASLNTVMLLYSENYILVYLALYIVCGFVLKRYDYALLLLLFNILFVSDTFYWPQTELPQGVALMVACFAFMESGYATTNTKLSWFILAIGIVTIAFYHPLIVFPFFFIVLFLLLNDIAPARRKMLYGATVFFIVAVVLKKLLFTDEYEARSIDEINKLKYFFPHYRHLYGNKLFLQACVTKYYWVPIIAMANILVYITMRQWLKLLLFIFGAGGFMLLVNVTHSQNNISFFYFEGMWLPLAIFIALPFIADVLPALQKKKVALAVVLLILITGCIRLYTTARPYTARLNWERRYLDVNQDKKLAVTEACVPADTLMMSWASPYEFWLLSTTERCKTASILIITDIYRYNWAFNQTRSFIVMGDVCPYPTLPKRYFKFTDTVTGYTLITK